MMTYILALDQGTSSSRAILFDNKAQIVGMEQTEFPQYYPKPGWVEHDPEEIWLSQLDVATKLLEKTGVRPNQIGAIGITNQRETTVLWDRETGKPVYRAIVWQDKRTAGICEQLKRDGMGTYVRENTGLVIDSYFSGTKLKWILDSDESLRVKAENGDLLFGTIDTWLIWKLSGGKLHITDYSNASRTMLFNIKELRWDPKLLDSLSVPASVLPEVMPSSMVYGNTAKEIFGTEIKIGGIAGDQQAALFGQTCFNAGMAKNTYGTGCFLLMNTGEKLVKSEHGLLSTIAWNVDGKVEYALEGSIFMAGAAIKWLRDGLKLIKNTSDSDSISKSIEESDGVYVVPAFTGLGAPYWDMYARGAIFGLTQGITDKHIVRATLEALAFQTKDILSVMEFDSGISLKTLNVDGGASVNDFLMQFQSDVLNTQVIRPVNVETTALGAAYLAGLAIGLWTKKEIVEHYLIDKTYFPQMEEQKRKKTYEYWKKAVERTKNWSDE